MSNLLFTFTILMSSFCFAIVNKNTNLDEKLKGTVLRIDENFSIKAEDDNNYFLHETVPPAPPGGYGPPYRYLYDTIFVYRGGKIVPVSENESEKYFSNGTMNNQKPVSQSEHHIFRADTQKQHGLSISNIIEGTCWVGREDFDDKANLDIEFNRDDLFHVREVKEYDDNDSISYTLHIERNDQKYIIGCSVDDGVGATNIRVNEIEKTTGIKFTWFN